MAASALLRSRVKRPSYLNKLAKAEDLVNLFPNGSYIGWSGFTGVGYPKCVLVSLTLGAAANDLSVGKSPPLWQTMSRRTTCKES